MRIRNFENALKKLETKGLSVNMERVKNDMYNQFSERNEYIREYIVNAYDAGATEVGIDTKQLQKNCFRQTISDNGKGMSMKGLEAFFSLFSSSKDKLTSDNVVGKFGIGKLSVCSIRPYRFVVDTCDGTEHSIAMAGDLLSGSHIKICRLDSIREPGTIFRIYFRYEYSLSYLISGIKDVVNSYLKFLPVKIKIQGEDIALNTWGVGNPTEVPVTFELKIENIRWKIFIKSLMSSYGKQFWVLQNKVKILGKYYQDDCLFPLNHICLFADSPDIQLPFGRHQLSNQDDLKKLERQLRDEYVPKYLFLLRNYYENTEDKVSRENFFYDVFPYMVCENIRLSCNKEIKDLKAFPTIDGHFISYNDCTKLGKFYTISSRTLMKSTVHAILIDDYETDEFFFKNFGSIRIYDVAEMYSVQFVNHQMVYETEDKITGGFVSLMFCARQNREEYNRLSYEKDKNAERVKDSLLATIIELLSYKIGFGYMFDYKGDSYVHKKFAHMDKRVLINLSNPVFENITQLVDLLPDAAADIIFKELLNDSEFLHKSGIQRNETEILMQLVLNETINQEEYETVC